MSAYTRFRWYDSADSRGGAQIL